MNEGRAPLDRRALGLALTRIADANVHGLMNLPEPSGHACPARRIAVTGAPGAGKSTLVGRLALHRCGQRRLGVLAIDPSSPTSGGAILGDRVRMDALAGTADLYIRSLGSRSATDGLSDNLPDLLDTMDAFQFDEVILETVGVGQAEYAARSQVDTLVLVLLPDSGDVVQAMKAGIMEMADIFVVNKSDLAGASRMATDVQRIVTIARRAPDAWMAPVLLTSALLPDGAAALSEAIDRHMAWRAAHSNAADIAVARGRYRLRRAIDRLVLEQLGQVDSAMLEMPLRSQVAQLLLQLRLTTAAGAAQRA